MNTPVDPPALSWLWGARVQRIDGPKPGLFAFSFFAEGDRSVLLLAVSAETRGVGRVSERPKGEAASSFVQRLRRAIENGRLTKARWLGANAERASALALHVARGDGEVVLIADFDRKAPNLFLLGNDGQLVGAADARALKLRGLSFGKPFVPQAAQHGIAIAHDADAFDFCQQRIDGR